MARRQDARERVRRRRHGLLRPQLAILLLFTLTMAVGAVLAACGGGGSAQTPASTQAAAPSPGSSPLSGSVEQAVATYWALVDADSYERLAAVCVPGSPAALSQAGDDVARARLISVARVTRVPGGAQAQVDVRVTPVKGATPWGDAGRHTLFMQLQRSGDGWLVAGWGTSP